MMSKVMLVCGEGADKIWREPGLAGVMKKQQQHRGRREGGGWSGFQSLLEGR